MMPRRRTILTGIALVLAGCVSEDSDQGANGGQNEDSDQGANGGQNEDSDQGVNGGQNEDSDQGANGGQNEDSDQAQGDESNSNQSQQSSCTFEEVHNGNLELEGGQTEAYEYNLSPGDKIRIDVRTIDGNNDAILDLQGPSGRTLVEANSARMRETVDVQNSGNHVIVLENGAVNPLAGGTQYTVSIELCQP